ncbi:MAG: tetratricopeptide repeat protein, partial [Alphaproteobacteria bacterium]|nr:tetratricopeptide repeat protein [Alphaproteobacteria bacterium]
ETVRLVPGRLAIDAERLATLAADRVAASDEDIARLCGSEFLAGLSLPGEAVSEWLAFERARLGRLAQAVLRATAKERAREGRHAEAIGLAERLLSLDPLREKSHRLLMRLHARAGERALALAQYQRCRELLSKELGVEPSSETAALADEIGRAAGTAEAVPAAAATVGSSPSAPAIPTSHEAGYNLSIAVLPFVNRSGEEEQDHLARGLAEDLITELSRQRDITVIARQSSFLFSGAPGRAAAAAGDLGVRYALAGSLRKSADRLRVTVQLIDATGDRCVWAERYDRPADALFALEDELVAEIIANVDARVREDERERAVRKHPENLDAWEMFHRGLWHVYRFTPEEYARATALFERAIALAPRFALPHAGLGYVAFVSTTWNFVDDPRAAVAKGLTHAGTAVALAGNEPFGHVVLGRLLTLAGDLPRAYEHLDRAVQLSPSFAQAHLGLAQALLWMAEPAAALMHADRAERLNPRDPLASVFMTIRAFAHLWLDELARAESEARRAMTLQPRDNWSRLALAVALVEQGRAEEARATVAEVRRIDPRLDLAAFGAVVAHVPAAFRDRVFAALRAAGMA